MSDQSPVRTKPAFLPFSLASIPGLVALWRETTGDPRVVIAVLDGPVDRRHSALAGANLIIVDAAVDSEPTPGGVATAHGTLVASLIFGQHGTASPVAGLAPACRGVVVPIFADAQAALGQGGTPTSSIPVCSQVDLARAILLAAEHEACIINISGGQYVPGGAAHPILVRAIAQCIGRGILIVAAAGNDGCACPHVPAAVRGVLAIGAMDEHNKPLELSNWGPLYRREGLLAPGARLIGARVPAGTSVVSGTSFASAIVSGAAGLLWSMALRQGRHCNGNQIRQVLLDSVDGCFDDALHCHRHLSGRLNLMRAGTLMRSWSTLMSEEQPVADSSTAKLLPGTTAGTERLGQDENYQPATDMTAVMSSSGVHVSNGDCGCASCSAAATAKMPSLVFALGTINYDLVSEARIDSIQGHMATGTTPRDPSSLLAYIAQHPWEASSVLWTLNVDQTPIYAIVPAGPFASEAYTVLREFLTEQIKSKIDRVSVAGRLVGRARLMNGQTLPIVMPELRGMYSWTTEALVTTIAGSPPKESAPPAEHEAHNAKRKGVRDFLERVYHELRNLGVSSQDRAINYTATHAFQLAAVFESAIKGSMELDTLEVERSQICRPESDCWDVKLAFFNPAQPVHAVRKMYRFTVDVSDVVPVAVGPVRSWFVR